jgi:galactofuranose transport system ATP-binding protein
MGEPAALLEVHRISKAFPGVKALDQVDFSLRAGEVHALLGENGAGKSTLIKILTGALPGDSGSIHLSGQALHAQDTAEAQRAGIAAVYQEVNLLPNLTVAENLFLGRQPSRFGVVLTKEMNARATALLAQFDLAIDVSRMLSAYSVAVQQIVAIARAVDLSARVLVLDEPTASLDAHEVTKLFSVMGHLKARGLGIIFITHFLDQVYAVSDRITVLRNGKRVGERVAAELSRLELVAMMLGKELASNLERTRGARERTGHSIASFRGFGRKRCVAPFELDLESGEVVGAAGLLGSGRTETAMLMFGALRADSGTALVDGKETHIRSPRDAIRLRFGYCPEDRKADGIVGDLSIRENIVLALQARRGWWARIPTQQQNEIAERFIRLLDIRTPDAEKPVKQLSGGNQQKALLARWLAIEPRLLILDEPTRGIDVGAHAEIIRLIEKLCADGMALYVISSEPEEIVAYSDRVSVMRDRKQACVLEGDAITTTAIMNAIAAPTHEEAARLS